MTGHQDIPDIRMVWSDTSRDVEFRSYTRRGLLAIERVLNGRTYVDRYNAMVAIESFLSLREFDGLVINQVNDPFHGEPCEEVL